MPKSWWMLGTMAAGAVVLATGAAAQDDTAFRTAMMARCATIGDKSARLACYDAAQHGGPVAMPAPAAAGSAPVAAGVAATAGAPTYASSTGSAEQFGRQAEREAPHTKSPNKISARAVAATDDGSGYWTIQLDSGARWKLIEHDSMFLPPERNASVQIRKGAMGGYLMQVAQQPAVRVRRVD